MCADSQGGGFFLALLEMLGDKPVAVVQLSYFDESERESGTLCVAGYAFAAPQARKFTKEWSRLFDNHGGFHMKHFAHRRGRYTGMSDAEHARMMREAVRIINSRMTAGVAVSCSVPEMRAVSPIWIRGFGNAYPVCCHWAMVALATLLKRVGVIDPIAYIFEKGHPHEAEARYFVATASLSPELKKYYRHHSDAFVPKSDAVPLQAADLLAWEWAKFRDETLERQLRPMRGSLRALFEFQPERYKVVHSTGVPLIKAMAKARELIYEQLAEQQAAIRKPI